MRKSVGALLSFGIATVVGMFATPSLLYAGTPFLGRLVMPGVIQAENYDVGGEGVAYHDNTPENEPGAYRTDGVDVEITSDEGGGYDVGWVQPGEWLKYSVYFPEGRYWIDVRYAAEGFGGMMHIEVGGQDVSGPIELSDTGGWQTWATVTASRLPFIGPGDREVRLVFDSGSADGWLANINYVAFRKAPSPAHEFLPIISARHSTRIEAESFDRGGEGVAYHDTTSLNEGVGCAHFVSAVDIERTSDVDGECDVGWITPGEWLFYTVDVHNPGPYNVNIRYAAEGYGGTMHIEYDGVDVSGPITLPDSGGWQTWATVTVPNVMLVDRAPGTLLRLVFDSGNADGWLANINWFEFVPAAQ